MDKSLCIKDRVHVSGFISEVSGMQKRNKIKYHYQDLIDKDLDNKDIVIMTRGFVFFS